MEVNSQCECELQVLRKVDCDPNTKGPQPPDYVKLRVTRQSSNEEIAMTISPETPSWLDRAACSLMVGEIARFTLLEEEPVEVELLDWYEQRDISQPVSAQCQ